jgi:uncharacterized protein (DUF427 family)
VRPRPESPGPGQESVWDYTRPPGLSPAGRRIRVLHGGLLVADTVRGWRVTETSHPPSYYVPAGDCRMDLLRPADGRSFCEWKGSAVYWDVVAGDRVAPAAAWSYPDPVPSFAAIRDHIAFFPGRVDECLVGDERARPQAGGFYGGWITDDVVGPFKGGPGTSGW